MMMNKWRMFLNLSSELSLCGTCEQIEHSIHAHPLPIFLCVAGILKTSMHLHYLTHYILTSAPFRWHNFVFFSRLPKREQQMQISLYSVNKIKKRAIKSKMDEYVRKLIVSTYPTNKKRVQKKSVFICGNKTKNKKEITITYYHIPHIWHKFIWCLFLLLFLLFRFVHKCQLVSFWLFFVSYVFTFTLFVYCCATRHVHNKFVLCACEILN